MKIEVMVRWAEVKKSSSNNDNILGNLEGENDRGIEIVYDYSRMTLDLNDVKRFNEGHSKDITVLRMDDGEIIAIKMNYDNFATLYADSLNLMVTSVVEFGHLGGEDEEEDKKEDEDDLEL